MQHHVVSREEWLAARFELLEQRYAALAEPEHFK
jgi:hypothetical protein